MSEPMEVLMQEHLTRRKQFPRSFALADRASRTKSPQRALALMHQAVQIDPTNWLVRMMDVQMRYSDEPLAMAREVGELAAECKQYVRSKGITQLWPDYDGRDLLRIMTLQATALVHLGCFALADDLYLKVMAFDPQDHFHHLLARMVLNLALERWQVAGRLITPLTCADPVAAAFALVIYAYKRRNWTLFETATKELDKLNPLVTFYLVEQNLSAPFFDGDFDLTHDDKDWHLRVEAFRLLQEFTPALSGLYLFGQRLAEVYDFGVD